MIVFEDVSTAAQPIRCQDERHVPQLLNKETAQRCHHLNWAADASRGGGEMKAKINGNQVHFELVGDDRYPVLMFSHSLASSSVSVWEDQLEAVQNHFRVLLYDMRGHGKSSVPSENCSLSDLVDDVIRLIDFLNISTFHFIGLSIGGMIGQGIALHHHDRLKSLTLCSTFSQTADNAKLVIDERIDEALTRGMKSQVDAIMHRWFSPSFLDSQEAVLSRIENQIADTSLAGYSCCLKAIRELQYTSSLHKIKVPTLIIVGENDPGAPISASETIHNEIQGSRMEIIPLAQHMTNIESPEHYNRILLDFLLQVR